MVLENLQKKIFEFREHKVMLDFDLALLYEVENRVLKQAVRRNIIRFPNDFMFQLNKNEFNELITVCDNLHSNLKFTPSLPFAFTEQGVAMLSTVLKSEKAILINIEIMRTFVQIRHYLYQVLNYLIEENEQEVKIEERKRIGFKTSNNK
jgi:hypothetical protein